MKAFCSSSGRTVLFQNKTFLVFCLVHLGVCHLASAEPQESLQDKSEGVLFTDTFPIPDEAHSIQALFEFVKQVDSQDTSSLSERDLVAHRRKVARTVAVVCDKALQLELNKQQFERSISFKFYALRKLYEIGEPTESKFFVKAVDAAVLDENPLVRFVAMKFYVEAGFDHWTTWNSQERQVWVDRVTKFLVSEDTKPMHLQMLMAVIDFLPQYGGEKQAKQMLDQLTPHFQESKDERVVAQLKSLEGISRRLNLPGKKIELSGTLLDGSKLDWSDFRGKVVLVDYWATSCRPCRAEMPNLIRQYADYHDKGFDIIGICVNENLKEAEKYVQKERIPWPILISKDKSKRGWKHPMAVRYGITGLPRAILVDRDGKVVHMNARGRHLAQQLRRMLGEPIARIRSHRDSLVQQVSRPPRRD